MVQEQRGDQGRHLGLLPDQRQRDGEQDKPGTHSHIHTHGRALTHTTHSYAHTQILYTLDLTLPLKLNCKSFAF